MELFITSHTAPPKDIKISKKQTAKVGSVCVNNYIISRTEWIEWWYCIPEQGSRGQAGQFARTAQDANAFVEKGGCSWACWDGKSESVDQRVEFWNLCLEG